MKKVLYISYDGMTDPLGQSQVIPYLRELTKQGYKFTLLSVEKKERLEKNGTLIRNILRESGITWETLLFTSSPPVLSKLYDQHQLNKKAIQLHKKEKFDFIHCRSYVAAATGLHLNRKFSIPFLFDMRGFWVDERVDSGLWNLSNPLYKYFYQVYKKKEQEYFSSAAHIISLTEKGKEELITRYKVAAAKISVIPCCADLELFDYNKISSSDKEQTKEQLGIAPATRVLSYLGSLGGWYMTDEMLEFFAVVIKNIPDSIFLFITHDNKEQIISKAAQKGIDSNAIRVIPASRNEVPGYLSISDWSIFFIKDLYSKKASSPTKQGEIMAMGIPIICNDIGDTGKIITGSNAGIVVNTFSTASYQSAIDQLLQLQVSTGKINDAAKKHFDLKNGADEYEKSYKKIIG